jgi:hypothetical protein
MGLDFHFGLDVEDLKLPLGCIGRLISMSIRKDTHTLESENLLLGMHDSRVCCDGSPQDIVRVGEVDDNDLVLLIDLFTDTYEVIRL